MRYRNHDITVVYHVGSNFKINRHGQVVNRKPRKEDIACYEVTQRSDGWEIGCELTIPKCKLLIDRFIQIEEMEKDYAVTN